MRKYYGVSYLMPAATLPCEFRQKVWLGEGSPLYAGTSRYLYFASDIWSLPALKKLNTEMRIRRTKFSKRTLYEWRICLSYLSVFALHFLFCSVT